MSCCDYPRDQEDYKAAAASSYFGSKVFDPRAGRTECVWSMNTLSPHAIKISEHIEQIGTATGTW